MTAVSYTTLVMKINTNRMNDIFLKGMGAVLLKYLADLGLNNKVWSAIAISAFKKTLCAILRKRCLNAIMLYALLHWPYLPTGPPIPLLKYDVWRVDWLSIGLYHTCSLAVKPCVEVAFCLLPTTQLFSIHSFVLFALSLVFTFTLPFRLLSFSAKARKWARVPTSVK